MNMKNACRMAVAGLLVTMAGTAMAEDQWALGTSSVGSGPYRWGAAVAEVVNPHLENIKISPQGTGGFNENILLLSGGEIPLAFGEASTAAAAYKGLPPFDPIEGGVKNLRWVTTAIIGVGHCFARADSGIASIEDVKGHPWNLNVQSSATRGVNDRIIAAAGLSNDDFKPFELSTGEVFDAMQNGIVDGSCNILNIGNAKLLSLATSTEFKLIPVDGDLYAKFSDSMLRGTVPVTIPAGTYPNQDEDIQTFGLVTPILTHAEVDEDQIYAFTKAFWENLDDIKKEPAFSSLEFTAELARGGGTVPVHPGAERYYGETLGN